MIYRGGNTMEKFSNKEVAEKLNMKPSTIAYYTNKGFVEPGVAAPTGKGTTRFYSKKNCVEIMLIKTMTDSGIKLEMVKLALDFIKDNHCKPDSKSENPLKKNPNNISPDILNPNADEESVSWYLIMYDDHLGHGFELQWIKENENISIDPDRLKDIAKVISLSGIVRKVKKL